MRASESDELRQAIYDCRERRLHESARWASLQLSGMDIPPGEKEQKADYRTQQPMATNEEKDAYDLALGHFDFRVSRSLFTKDITLNKSICWKSVPIESHCQMIRSNLLLLLSCRNTPAQPTRSIISSIAQPPPTKPDSSSSIPSISKQKNNVPRNVFNQLVLPPTQPQLTTLSKPSCKAFNDLATKQMDSSCTSLA